MTAGKGKGAKVDPAGGKAATGRLAGKVALVTGAAGNLGGAIIRRFIAEGATLVMTGRTKERLAAAKQALLDETGVEEARVFTVILDGADPDSVRAGIDQVRAALGRIDVLVNNAGWPGRARRSRTCRSPAPRWRPMAIARPSPMRCATCSVSAGT